MPTDGDAARLSQIPPGVGLRSPVLSPQVLFASPTADKSGKGEEIPTVQGFPLGKDKSVDKEKNSSPTRNVFKAGHPEEIPSPIGPIENGPYTTAELTELFHKIALNQKKSVKTVKGSSGTLKLYCCDTLNRDSFMEKFKAGLLDRDNCEFLAVCRYSKRPACKYIGKSRKVKVEEIFYLL